MISILIYPFIFLSAIIIGVLVWFDRETTPKSSEGFVFLQSFAFFYRRSFIISNHYSDATISITIIALLFFLYSVYHAYSYKTLSKRAKLSLSIGSSFMMLFLSINYLYRIIISYADFSPDHRIDYISISIESFLFGISILYIVQNIILSL